MSLEQQDIMDQAAQERLERWRAEQAVKNNPEPEKDDDVPMVPKHWAEMMMMHHSKDIRAVVRGFIIAFALMVIMAWIFIAGYTSRTKDWLNTLAGLQAMKSPTTHSKPAMSFSKNVIICSKF